jgi:hypothetical protein
LGAGKVGIQVMNHDDKAIKVLTLMQTNNSGMISKGSKAEDIVNLVIPVYEKHYSEQDIEQLIIFYKSR